MDVETNVDLLQYNTFGISVRTEKLVHLRTESNIEEYFNSTYNKPSLILGGGSNLLLTKDIEGIVLRVEVAGIKVIKETDDHVFVQVGAGENWHQFVIYCIQNGWAGIENLSLIPGNVGTAPMQNIGAYGVEIESVFDSLQAYIIDDKSWQSFSRDECNFGYRESIFKRALKDKALIASVTFRLSKKPNFNTSYGAIEAELERMNVQDLSIKAISDAVLTIRQSKLPDPAKIGNSGSFFKNPVIYQSAFDQLKTEYSDMVGYPSGDGKVKVAAGWLIEQAGFKGMRVGNYGVHEKQALVLVNYGGASGQQIFDLSEQIIESIDQQFGILLEREVNVI